ncbi:MAG: DHH family phosphoesterase [Desulfarculaceae bacterium]|jgi:nanoRNase/pAp phosphatase (c-di-AMP/oligoRNAs hydrolase)
MTTKRNAKAGKRRSLPDQARRLLAQFEAEDRVLIIITADPDALASALALKRILWRRVTSVTIARSNEINRPDNQTMVRLLNIPLEPISSVNAEDYSKLVMLDSQPHHNVAFSGLTIDVVIDHHPLAESNGNTDSFSDIRPRYGATSTIMTEYLRGARIKPSTRLATALVYGIKNDTSGFQRPSLLEDVQAFQFLFPKANQSVLRKIEFSEMRVKDLDILRLALDRAVKRKHSMYAHLGQVKHPDNLVQIADFFLKVDSVDSCAISGVFQQTLVVIVRSASLGRNAGKLTQKAFGELGSAGGHKAAARAEVPLGVLKDILGDIDDEIVGKFVIRRMQKPRTRAKKTAAAA